MRRVAYVMLLLLPGCLGNLELVGPDAGPGAPPPPPPQDGGVTPPPPPPGTDAGGVLPLPTDAGTSPIPDAGPAPMTWRGVLIAGDDTIVAFDNARERITQLFVGDGVLEENLIQLSRDRGEQTGGVRDTTVSNIETAMMDLGIGDNDACIMFMTSHGNRTGFQINGRDPLTPTRLDQILDDACGDRPTVALISACYSGVFIDPLSAPNRIVLTAARDDRTSFGCSAEATYTYWDSCLITEYPMASTWRDLYENVAKCIEEKEGGGFTPSYPQASLGADVADMPIFGR